jgi:hypothetical protein
MRAAVNVIAIFRNSAGFRGLSKKSKVSFSNFQKYHDKDPRRIVNIIRSFSLSLS